MNRLRYPARPGSSNALATFIFRSKLDRFGDLAQRRFVGRGTGILPVREPNPVKSHDGILGLAARSCFPIARCSSLAQPQARESGQKTRRTQDDNSTVSR